MQQDEENIRRYIEGPCFDLRRSTVFAFAKSVLTNFGAKMLRPLYENILWELLAYAENPNNFQTKITAITIMQLVTHHCKKIGFNDQIYLSPFWKQDVLPAMEQNGQPLLKAVALKFIVEVAKEMSCDDLSACCDSLQNCKQECSLLETYVNEALQCTNELIYRSPNLGRRLVNIDLVIFKQFLYSVDISFRLNFGKKNIEKVVTRVLTQNENDEPNDLPSTTFGDLNL